VASVPVAIGRAMEHFAEKFLLSASSAVTGSGARTLAPHHLKMAMLSNPHFAFLEPILREVGMPVRAGDAYQFPQQATVQSVQHMQQQQALQAAAPPIQQLQQGGAGSSSLHGRPIDDSIGSTDNDGSNGHAAVLNAQSIPHAADVRVVRPACSHGADGADDCCRRKCALSRRNSHFSTHCISHHFSHRNTLIYSTRWSHGSS
ncbi:hypothetical protein PFISCL1PPCAC_28750, partial [Pristionchus fissidentatus]